MTKAITKDTISEISNPDFVRYAQMYIDIEEDYRDQVRNFGLPFADDVFINTDSEKVHELEERGLVVANDRKSLTYGWVSPSCIVCREGFNTATFSISTQCSRNCFFCFNPNQVDYEKFKSEKDDVVEKLAAHSQAGDDFIDLALTGGEPLLHKPEVEEFFRQAKALYPHAYVRLYTSGDFLDEEFLQVLRDCGLDEIRISVKMDDEVSSLERTLDLLELSKEYISRVLVEMPVMPDEFERMKALLLVLDEIEIDGINLLELCFPGHNAEEFAKRGYQLKSQLYRVFYNYIYAGGLPIAGSEEVCIKLLEYAIDEGLRLGVHYCSLENKFSGQVNLQNRPHVAKYPFCELSESDYFLKSIKAFGEDIPEVERILRSKDINYYIDTDDSFIQFHPRYLEVVRASLPAVELGLAYSIVEQRAENIALRELRIELM